MFRNIELWWINLNTNMDLWAGIYDQVYFDVNDDIDFYVQECIFSKGSVLELGCGTGRVTIPIAKTGIDILAIDNSIAMMKVALEKINRQDAAYPNLQFVGSDMRNFAFDKKFTLIIIPFRGFQSLLNVNDQIQTITNIKNHLTVNGRLIFNTFVPSYESIVSAHDVLYHHKDVEDFDNHRKFIIWNQSEYDQFNQIVYTRIVVDELNNKEQVVNRFYRDFSLRYAFRWELYHLLTSNGFKLLNLYGDFEKSDFDDSSTEMIWEFSLA